MTDFERPTPEESAAARAKHDEMLADFEKNRPCELAAMRLVASIVDDILNRSGSTRSEREHQFNAQMVQSGFNIFSDWLKDAPLELRETMFELWLKTGMGFYGCGAHSAPDVSRNARDAKAEQDEARAKHAIIAVRAYLSVKDMEPSVSREFAKRIRPDLLDGMGLSPNAKHPSVNAIIEALSVIKKN